MRISFWDYLSDFLQVNCDNLFVLEIIGHGFFLFCREESTSLHIWRSCRVFFWYIASNKMTLSLIFSQRKEIHQREIKHCSVFPRQLAVFFWEVKTLQWSASDGKYKLMHHSQIEVIRLKFCYALNNNNSYGTRLKKRTYVY